MILTQQQSCIDKLSRVKVGALFMEAGSGKTLSALELINSTKCDYVIWLTPFQTKQNLKDEIEKWQIKKMPYLMNVDIDVIGIETLQNSDRTYLGLISKANKNNTFIVCDESLKIKNKDAKRTKRIIEIGKLCEYKLILNGTPLSRNLLDIWSQFQFLSPKILNMNYTEFKNTFCEYTIITIRKNNQRRTKEFINCYHNVDILYKLIEPFVYECDLKLMTKIQYVDIYYSTSESEKKEHNFLKEKYLDNEWLMSKPNFFLELTQKMQQNYSLSKEKFKYLDEVIKKHKKVLICCKYINTQKELKKLYPDQKILSWQKHSFGLNLQEYNVLVKFDKHWDYALHEQLEHRIYRTGQEKDCIIYDFTSDLGLDGLMKKNVEKKEKLLNYFKNKSINELKKLL